MKLSTHGLQISSKAAVDLQLHTTLSDGEWEDESLIDYLMEKGFALAAITDHDRVDTTSRLQTLARTKGFPLLVAVEMSAKWKGQLTDLLCFGFDPQNNALASLTEDLADRQRENSRQVFAHLLDQGYDLNAQDLEEVLIKPVAQQVHGLLALISKHVDDQQTATKALIDGGFAYMTHEPAAIVEATQQSGGVCILAHPGRQDGFLCYDQPLLDAFLAETNIDGIEVYYPKHTPEQIKMYLAFAESNRLLVSAGSDSHSIDRPPIKYRAELAQPLLERLGIQVSS